VHTAVGSGTRRRDGIQTEPAEWYKFGFEVKGEGEDEVLDVSRSTVYSQLEVFHNSKLPRPESYPPTSMSFSRATVPARADHGVVALSIGTIGMYGTTVPAHYLVFFLREALLRLFRQQEQERPLEEEGELEDQEEPYVVVDWADWGPKTSRWFLAPAQSLGPTSIHGYRFATLVTRLGAALIISPNFTQAGIDIILGTNNPPPDTDTDTDTDTDANANANADADAGAGAPLHLLVFDFNPYPLRRHQFSLGPPPIGNSPPLVMATPLSSHLPM
jgi:hypothetical protein